jgi:hypothetical protein
MAKQLSKGDTLNLEFHPDAWDRFERAAGVVAKTPPQHRTAVKSKASPKRRRKPKEEIKK